MYYCVTDTLNPNLKSLCARSIAASMKSFDWEYSEPKKPCNNLDGEDAFWRVAKLFANLQAAPDNAWFSQWYAGESACENIIHIACFFTKYISVCI